MALDPIALKALALELSAAMPPPPPRACVALPLVDTSPRARAIRRISEIVNARCWQLEVTRTLDRFSASYIDDLPIEEVFALRDRVERYEDNLQYGFDLHDISASFYPD